MEIIRDMDVWDFPVWIEPDYLEQNSATGTNSKAAMHSIKYERLLDWFSLNIAFVNQIQYEFPQVNFFNLLKIFHLLW